MIPTAIIILLLTFTAYGCGGGGGGGGNTPKPPNPTPIISISISPATQNIQPGQPATLTVNAQNTAITWPAAAEVAGSFTTSGNTVTWTPPAAAGTYEFTVTATADTSKRATARVTVSAPVVSIGISAESERVRAGQSVKLTVTTQNTGITWPAASAVAGSFTTSGNEAVWTLPTIAGTYSFTVTATADTSKRATATITVFIPSENPVDTVYYGINNNGLIVGAGIYSDGTIRAFQKNGGSITVFDNPNAFDYTYAIGINDSGQILGYYENGYFLKTGSNYQAVATRLRWYV